MERIKRGSDARRRILETADALMYAEGVRTVGIDRIVASSGVAKMTLYSHFGSKDQLILAVLQHREKQFMAWFGRAMDRRVEAGERRLDALFATLREWFASPTFRGCAFINASVELADPEHPGAVFAREHKARFHAFLNDLIKESLGRRAAGLTPAVFLLVQGAIVTAYMESTPAPADVARDATLKLLSQVEPK